MMILIKCCRSCTHYTGDWWCAKHETVPSQDDWCPDWEFDCKVEKVANCINCKYYRGTHDDGKTKCGNPDQWNTWIKPEQGCEWWKEARHDK